MNQRMWSVAGAVIAAALGGAAWGQRARGEWVGSSGAPIVGVFTGAAVAQRSSGGLQAVVLAEPLGHSTPLASTVTLVEPGGQTPLVGLPVIPTSAAIVSGGPTRGVYVAGSTNGGWSSQVYRWDSPGWTALPVLLAGVEGMTTADLGDGERLYVSGLLWGFGSRGVASWDGSAWRPVGQAPGYFVRRVRAVDIGGVRRLVVGGYSFDSTPALSNVAIWDGQSWLQLPGNGLADVMGIASLPTGPGGAGELYVGGSPDNPAGDPAVLQRWDGAAWHRVAGYSALGAVFALESIPDARGPGGMSLAVSAQTGEYLYDLAAWTRVDVGSTRGFSGRALDLSAFGGGWWGYNCRATSVSRGGQDLIDTGLDQSYSMSLMRTREGDICAGGSFLGRWALARWNGRSWTLPLVGGPDTDFSGLDAGVRAVVRWKAPGRAAPDLYVAGDFGQTWRPYPVRLGRFDGETWDSIGTPDSLASALEVFDDGSGERLYVGGEFTNVAGVAAPGLAVYDGAAWSAIEGVAGRIASLRAYDDGDGPALWVTGNMLINGEPSGIARKRRAGAWESLSPRSIGRVRLSVIDLGDGPALYLHESIVSRWNRITGGFEFVGPGNFEHGGLQGGDIAGLDAIEVTTPGGGTRLALVAGGSLQIDWRPCSVAVFDGAVWRPIHGDDPGGVAGLVASPDRKAAMVVGQFSSIGATPANAFATLKRIAVTCDGDADFDGSVGMGDLALVVSEYGRVRPDPLPPDPPVPSDAGDLNFDGRVNFFDLMIVLGVFGQSCAH